MVGKKLFTRHKSGSLLGVYVLFCIIALGFSGSNVIIRPKQLGLSLFAIFQQGGTSIGRFFSETFNSIRELGDLKMEYSAALERLKHFETIEKDIKALEDENLRLKEVLQFSRDSRFQNIPAQIIGKDPQNYHSTITINKGSLSGIRKNMPVVAIQGGRQGLIGKVAAVGLNASLIQPLYDPNAFVAARLLSSRYEGLVNGSGEDSVTMRYVKKYARPNIRFGDIVVTSGMTSLYPPDIYIGTVKTIHARDYDTSLELDIEPIIDFAKLEHVYILQLRERGE